MTEAVDPSAVVYEASLLSQGDDVALARSDYEWASPLEVLDVEHIEWLDEHGSVQFGTAAVSLTTGRGNPHEVTAVAGRDAATWQQGDVQDVVTTFEPVDETDPAEDAVDQINEAAEEFLDRVEQPEEDTPSDDSGGFEKFAPPDEDDDLEEGADSAEDQPADDVAFDETVAVDEPDEEPVDDGLERDYPADMVVDDLGEVSAVRHRSMRQQVRAAPDDIDDEELAVKIGATVEVARQLRVQAADIEARKQDTGAAARVTCENCGESVSQRYAEVFSPEKNPDSVQCCPACPDMIRDGADVREARSTRDKARLAKEGGR